MKRTSDSVEDFLLGAWNDFMTLPDKFNSVWTLLTARELGTPTTTLIWNASPDAHRSSILHEYHYC
jgi:hypothetical protein